jgi:serine protease AprX
VSQVIAGIDWVVQHAHDPGLDIRVLNLSFGTDSAQSFQVDPLAYATEVAWKAGIVVVASAGNAGHGAGSLSDPAMDPYVIAVGAVDMNGHPDTGSAFVPSFSSWGNGVRNPDLIAPGDHVQSLTDTGSYIGGTYGSTGSITNRFFRGSGTSEATAFVSGAAALLVQEFPSFTADQIKAVMVSTAQPINNVSSEAQGAGVLNFRAASGPVSGTVEPNAVATPQSFPPSSGTGSLAAARGTDQLDLNNVTLSSNSDIMGQAVDTGQLAVEESKHSAWSGGSWNGTLWSGSSWSGSRWSGASWTGNDWSGSRWSSDDWSSGTWSGSSWTSASWLGSSWSGSRWSGSRWSGGGWSGGPWATFSWS